MAKTYILEPTELQFEYDSTENRLYYENFMSLVGDVSFADTFIEVEGYSFKVKYAGEMLNLGALFTEDGIMPPEDDGPAFDVSAMASYHGAASLYLVSPSLPKENCTLTVSIYTGEDDPEPTPGGGSISKNFAFVDHPRNDLNGIAEIVAPFESEEN